MQSDEGARKNAMRPRAAALAALRGFVAVATIGP
jgi:hypothetical protein